MSVPDFQTLMLPLLQLASDGKEHSIAEARESLAAQFHLTEQERAELLPSGRQARFDNRVAWAKSFLQQAGVLTAPRRGHFQISDRGRQLLQENPPQINIKALERYPEFVEFRSSSRKKETEDGEIESGAAEHETPEELLESAHSASEVNWQRTS